MLFSTTLVRFRTSAASSVGLPSLRRRLRRLRQTNRAANELLQERRRIQRLLREVQGDFCATSGSGGSGASAPGATTAHLRTLELLPRNDALEAAIALSISENRDARTELELVRRLVNSTLLSLASPVAKQWDPYDVKPQVFALDNYIALPVFTSFDYLRLFCERFGLPVRDPSGALWTSGSSRATSAGGEVPLTCLLPDALLQSEWWQQRHGQQPAEGSTEVSMREMDTAVPMAGVSQERRPSQDGEARVGATEVHTSDRAGVALRTAELTPPQVSPDRVVPQGTPPTSLADIRIDADALFDTMLMDGIVEDGSQRGTSRVLHEKPPSTPATGAERTRAQRRSRRVKGKVRVIGRQLASSRHHPLPRERLAKRRQVTPDAERAGASCGGSAAEAESANAVPGERKAAYWEFVAQTAPFGLTQATPLPMFGPLLHSFLIGYFADVSTLLHNASIVPEKVDIVLNPASPLEFVLSRAATDRVLQKEQLLHYAYLKVEKELQREFGVFFASCCPEVLSASTACVPLPLNADEVNTAWRASQHPVKSGRRGSESRTSSSNELQTYRERTRLLREAEYRNGVAYEIVLLIQSSSLGETFKKIQQAKHQSVLMGHADLDVLPEMAAAPHVREMARRFYDGASERDRMSAPLAIAGRSQRGVGDESLDSGTASSDGEVASHVPGGMGVFMRRGKPCTINVVQPADSYFHTPTNAYTEAHAVFTEDLKVNRGQ
ncbi:hypothetical protein JKF63_00568 [Porcisia hertigi]|uniref:Uncharacterized protein n=1 Tax=Porcisia hertigi TaxID=2761500 RepID=A0A836L711_9TRYP|nr:hypothetical protein JKF63_00568 [Porcisia hertigi]